MGAQGELPSCCGSVGEMTDREKRQGCMDKANQDFGDCLKGCQDSLDNTREDALQCRNTCIDQLQQCTTKR